MKIIVTGASKGLGKTLAEEFIRKGNQVGLIARSEHLLNEICRSLGAEMDKPQMHVYACDLTSAGGAEAAVSALAVKLGGVDVLINCASNTVKKGLMEISVEEWQLSMSSCVDSAFYCTRAVMPHFVKQGGGHIINIGSLSTQIPLERGVSYSASKHALNGFSRSVAHEFHGAGVKVCTIHSGAFKADNDQGNDWKMPESEVFRACEYILSSHPKAFVEEVIVRPLIWPE